MNIFIFCGPAAFGKGGMEKVAINVANYWSNKGHNVSLGYFSRKNQSVPAYKTSESVSLVPWHQGMKRYCYYRTRILEESPDVIIVFAASSQIVRIMSMIHDMNVPIIIHEGGNPERVVTENWANDKNISVHEARWEREVIYSCAAVIRMTMECYKTSLPPFLRSRVVAFPNAFKAADFNKQDTGRKKRIINIGGMKPNKNFGVVLDAFSKVANRFNDWEVVVCSAEYQTEEGRNYADMLQNKIVELGLENRVHLKGEVDDIEREYENSDIHVIASLSEGFSSCVAEAMCAGLPSIGIRGVPGVDGLIVDRENGILVDYDDAASNLATAFAELMSDSGRRETLGSRARKKAETFSPEYVYPKWDEVLRYAVRDNCPESKNDEVFRHYKRMANVLFRSISRREVYEGARSVDLWRDIEIVRGAISDGRFELAKQQIFESAVHHHEI